MEKTLDSKTAMIPISHPDLGRGLDEIASPVSKPKASLLFRQGESPAGVFVLIEY